MLEWTGERYLPFVDPSVSGAEIHYEHLHRYAFASHLVKGRSSYVLYRLVWMGARRPPPDPDARRPDGADRPRTAPPAQLLV